MKDDTKRCSRCGKMLAATTKHFYVRNRSRDGLTSKCRPCIRKLRRAYNATPRGREYHKIFSKKYRGTLEGYLVCVYRDMKRRCTNPAVHNWQSCGGNGIRVEFASSAKFIVYVKEGMHIIKLSQIAGLQCGRINKSKHYEPGNIKFVTCKENNSNRRERR